MLEAARKLDVGSGWMTGTAVFEQVTGVLCILFEIQSIPPPLCSLGAQILQRERDIIKITSGCKALDAILGGGVETKSITEIHGEYR